MKYFKETTDIEAAKTQYRALAKQLHPDKGGTAAQFQQMKQEYKTLLQQLGREQKQATMPPNPNDSKLLSELGKLAKVLIEKQVPQRYLNKKIQNSQSPLEKAYSPTSSVF